MIWYSFSGWWVNVQCCFYHFWSYQMRRRPNSPFGRGVFCDGLLAVTVDDINFGNIVLRLPPPVSVGGTSRSVQHKAFGIDLTFIKHLR
jgi:hypothetical protein